MASELITLLPVIVKNTFLDLQEPSPCQPRRCTSVPRSWRVDDVDHFGFNKEPRIERWSDASTEADEEDDVSSTDGNSVSDPQFDAPKLSSLNPNAPEWSPMGPSICMTVPKVQAIEKPRLNSKAKVWRPTVTMPAMPPPAVQLQFTSLVMAAKTALKQSKFTAAVEVNESSHGWTIVVDVPRQTQWRREQTLKVAKDALLGAAEVSDSVYVQGYLDKPFLGSGSGFTATLSSMTDESKACWDIFTKGFCSRQGCCRWQHPDFTTTVQVTTSHADLD